MSELQPKLPRWTWRVFILAMVTIIGVLVIVQSGDAMTLPSVDLQCRTRSESVSDGGGYSLTSKAEYCAMVWLGEHYRKGAYFVDGGDANDKRYPNWFKYYGEGLNTFVKWLPERDRKWEGRTTSPNGQPNVEYQTKETWAEFKECDLITGRICWHETKGIKHQVWANGESRAWKLSA